MVSVEHGRPVVVATGGLAQAGDFGRTGRSAWLNFWNGCPMNSAGTPVPLVVHGQPNTGRQGNWAAEIVTVLTAFGTRRRAGWDQEVATEPGQSQALGGGG